MTSSLKFVQITETQGKKYASKTLLNQLLRKQYLVSLPVFFHCI